MTDKYKHSYKNLNIGSSCAYTKVAVIYQANACALCRFSKQNSFYKPNSSLSCLVVLLLTPEHGISMQIILTKLQVVPHLTRVSRVGQSKRARKLPPAKKM